MQEHNPWRDFIYGAAIFLVSALFVFAFSCIHFETHHTGLVYRTALDVLNGKILFRDTFTKYGALTALLHALGLLLFGRRVLSILFVSALFYAASFSLFYLLCRRYLSRPLSLTLCVISLFLAPFYFWDFTPWASVFSLFFLLFTTYVLLSAVERDAAHLHAWGGLCTALTFWCRQPVGIMALLACLLYYVLCLCQGKERPRHLLAYTLGVAVGLATFLLPLTFLGALDDFYHQSIEGMVQNAVDPALLGGGFLGTVGRIFTCLFLSPLTDALAPYNLPWLFLPLAALVFTLAAAWHLLHRRQKDARALLLLGLLSLSSWHQYYPVPCQRHWYWGAFPCLVPLGILLSGITRHLPRRRTMALWLLLVLLFSPAVGYRAVHGARKLASTEHLIYYKNEAYGDLDGLYLRPAVAEHFDAIIENTDTLKELFPDRNIVNLTQNEFYAIFGEDFLHLYESDCYYSDYTVLLADYIARYRPILIAPEAPDDSYVLWRRAVGDHNDDWFAYHDLPADLYLPRELYDALPDTLK